MRKGRLRTADVPSVLSLQLLAAVGAELAAQLQGRTTVATEFRSPSSIYGSCEIPRAHVENFRRGKAWGNEMPIRLRHAVMHDAQGTVLSDEEIVLLGKRRGLVKGFCQKY